MAGMMQDMIAQASGGLPPTLPPSGAYQQGAMPPGGIQPAPAPGEAAALPPPPPPGQHTGGTSPFAPVQGMRPPTGPAGVEGPEFGDPRVRAPGQADIGPGTEFGGQTTMNAQAGPADYQGVQGFADQAYTQARRNLDPQQEQMTRRMSQDLVNKGIDPSSPQGKAMLDQQNRNISDQNSKASFDALRFGQGMQQQMFGQDMARTQQAGQMQQAKWQADLGRSGQDIQRYQGDQQFELGKMGQDLQRYGMDQQYDLGQSGQDLQRYGMESQFNLGMGNLDMRRQGQDFNQMLGLEGVDFRNRRYNDSRSDYQDQLTMALMGGTPVPGAANFDPSGLAGTQIGNSAGGGLISGLLG